MHLPGIAGEKTDAEGTDLIYEGITTQVWWSAISDFKFQKH